MSLFSITDEEKVLEAQHIKDLKQALNYEYIDQMIAEDYLQTESNDELYNLLKDNLDLDILTRVSIGPGSRLRTQVLVGQLIWIMKENSDFSDDIKRLINENRRENGDIENHYGLLTEEKNAFLLWDLVEEFYELVQEDKNGE